jgi:putative flippase GtrA
MLNRLRDLIDLVYREALKFGAVGAVAYVVDVYVYNILRTGWWPAGDAPLDHKPVLAKVFSVAVATVVAWLGNRYWTFRRRRRSSMRRELALFVTMNIGGMLIAAACIGVSHYLLGFDSPLADNIAGNVVGLVLGTLFRFWAYRTLVFTEVREDAALPAPTSPI